MTNQSAMKILARHGKSFHWASFFLGRRLAASAAELYQFCRFVDDLADGNEANRTQRLIHIREALHLKRNCDEAEVNAFLKLAEENNIPSLAAVELIDGMLADQKPARFCNRSELLRYCHAVAGTVGLMMCRILRCQQARADSFAIDLGVALQLTNIARDVLEDAEMGRRYLPSEWINLDDTQMSPESLVKASPEVRIEVAKAIEQLLQLSEKYYTSAKLGIHLLPFKSRFAILVALRIYRAIGCTLEGRSFAWWNGRVVVPKMLKIVLSIASMRALLPRNVPPHCDELHIPLRGLAGVGID